MIRVCSFVRRHLRTVFKSVTETKPSASMSRDRNSLSIFSSASVDDISIELFRFGFSLEFIRRFFHKTHLPKRNTRPRSSSTSSSSLHSEVKRKTNFSGSLRTICFIYVKSNFRRFLRDNTTWNEHRQFFFTKMINQNTFRDFTNER